MSKLEENEILHYVTQRFEAGTVPNSSFKNASEFGGRPRKSYSKHCEQCIEQLKRGEYF